MPAQQIITVGQLIKILEQHPQDAVVYCLTEKQRGCSCFADWKKLHPDDIYFNGIGNWLQIGDK